MIRVSNLKGCNPYPFHMEHEICKGEDSKFFKTLNSQSRGYVELIIYDKGQIISPYGLPMVNTFILLCSATVLNSSHLALRNAKRLNSAVFLSLTIILGIFFMFFQCSEYNKATLKFNDGIYASCLYSLTGLHGFHVALGICVLFICFINILKKNYTAKFHQSFYYAIMY